MVAVATARNLGTIEGVSFDEASLEMSPQIDKAAEALAGRIAKEIKGELPQLTKMDLPDGVISLQAGVTLGEKADALKAKAIDAVTGNSQLAALPAEVRLKLYIEAMSQAENRAEGLTAASDKQLREKAEAGSTPNKDALAQGEAMPQKDPLEQALGGKIVAVITPNEHAQPSVFLNRNSDSLQSGFENAVKNALGLDSLQAEQPIANPVAIALQVVQGNGPGSVEEQVNGRSRIEDGLSAQPGSAPRGPYLEVLLAGMNSERAKELAGISDRINELQKSIAA